jgi:hypothetical protein
MQKNQNIKKDMMKLKSKENLKKSKKKKKKKKKREKKKIKLTDLLNLQKLLNQ